MTETLTVRTPGLTTLQDLGRVGRSRYGLPANGAVDQHSARVANILCGNHERAPLLEITAHDFACTASADILIAVTGAPAGLTVDGVARSQWEPVSVRAGETVRVAGIHRGLRVYLAVLGSLKADYLQGSCAPDTILGFGSALREGEQVGLRASCPPLDHPFSRIPLFRLDAPAAPFPDHRIIDVTDGPDRAEFGTTGSRLFDAPFTVSQQSNHIGLRLHGDVPRRVATGEVLSRGVPIGAIEVPAGDELLVLHRGRGVTAGYPVLGVVTATGLSALGQVRPGQRVRFRHRTLDQAVTAYRTQRSAVAALKTRVRVVFDSLRIPVPADG